ncbi:UNVERIFIED_CONTAM: hypothetical protein HDU68_003974 [Siphonaria sp. JEL0065]|nr:hypothetical protein HDU68_003974 [Siphonaria sp. JEL0065]
MKSFFASLGTIKTTRSSSETRRGSTGTPLSPPPSPVLPFKNLTTVSPRPDRKEAMLALNGNVELTQLQMFKRLHSQWQEAVIEGVNVDAAHRINLSSFLAVMKGAAHLEIVDPVGLDVALQASIDILAQRNNDVYGVNTGFGGNADMRSDDAQAVQVGLIKHLNAGMANHCHDAEVTRGAMILRVLSMSRGGSAVRLELIETLIKLIEARVTPCVPLRGSISASGDLMPLSYVAGLISGRFQHDEKAATGANGEFLTGKQALRVAGIAHPISFAAKEALALVNGTSFSCSMAASCVLDAHSLALLTQVLTAFSTEALAGHVDAFDPAVARLRPHPGQIELCKNISHLLRDSHLVGNDKSALAPLLWRRTMPQDRYSIRTAPQWLCPLIECLTQITKTIEIEINSVTDNPLVDVANKSILHAGNFQALSVADTMDRLRLQLHNAGRLIFAQHSELINPALSQGLPANLAWGHPGTDFGFKGLDVSMASYLSELGDLALPMSPHVQSAELHNQAVNSLALISARKTARALEVLQMMSACLIASLCQAADLRAMESTISKRIRDVIVRSLKTLQIKTDSLVDDVLNSFASKLLEHREIGWAERIDLATHFAVGIIVASPECKCTITKIQSFGEIVRRDVLAAVQGVQNEVGAGQGDRVLSSSAKNLYLHIRKTKGIPMYKDSQEFNVGRMLDQVLAFVQNREELDQVILDSFEGVDRPAAPLHNLRPSARDSSDSDDDDITARDSFQDSPFDSTVVWSTTMPAPPSPRTSGAPKSFNSPQFNSKQTAPSKLKVSASLSRKVKPAAPIVLKEISQPPPTKPVEPVTISPPHEPSLETASTASPSSIADVEAGAVAIVGIGCRYPQGIETLDGFWEALVNAKDLITEIPTKTRQSFRRACPTIRGGWLTKESVEEFDCGMFGMSPSEAKSMDPQHRIILETVYSALEDANIPADSLRGSDTGVFMGCRPAGHDVRQFELYGFDGQPRYSAVGSDLTFSANRISFWLDLKGPSYSVTSACSTGGVLLDMAVRALQQGQCKTAIVGAMSVISHEAIFGYLESAGIQSVEAGRCASYDKDADGYVPTESAVVFILKKVNEAVVCGDRVVATISAVSDRHKGKEGLGITYPCGDANAAAIEEVLARANWSTDDVDFIEAHATGTKTGDPVEAAAIAKAFKAGKRTIPVTIGAVKSIVGHTENVAALTAMLKVALAMKENVIPPTLLDPARLNPAVEKSFKTIPAVIPTTPTLWPVNAVEKKSLVLAAGLGGSVIAVAMKAPPSPVDFNVSALKACRVLTISASSAISLSGLRDSYVALISNSSEEDVAKIAVSSNLGRQHLRQRLAFPVENKKTLLTALEKWVPVKSGAKKQPIVFVFPGQGSLDLKACAELFRTVAAFRVCIEDCTTALRELSFPTSILDNVFSGSVTEVRGEYEQVVLLILQYSVAKTMMKIGIEPSCVVGHSFGEIVAVTVAGGLSLKDALVLTHERHKPMLQSECMGVMTSCFAGLDVVQAAIQETGAAVDVAAHNGTLQHVISGSETEVEKVAAHLTKSNVQCRRLPNIIAFHSRRVAAAAASFQKSMKSKFNCNSISIPLASCLTKTLMPVGAAVPLKHWVDHITSPVLFAGAISVIDAEYMNATYIDIGSGSIASLVRRHLTSPGLDRQYLGALSSLGAVVANLFVRGLEIDWSQLHGSIPRTAMSALPLYRYARVPVWDDNVGLLAGKSLTQNIPMQVVSSQPQVERSRIAVVGMAVRMPGGVESLDHLWRVMKSDGTIPGPLPLDRPKIFYKGAKGLKAAFIDEAFMLDSSMFGFSPEEAFGISPRLRVQLETAYRAIEDANMIPGEFGPYRAGVFSNNSAGSHDLYSNRLVVNGIKTSAANGLFVPEENGIIAQKLGFKNAQTLAINGYCDTLVAMLQAASDGLQKHRIDVAVTNSVRVLETEGHIHQDSLFSLLGGGFVGEASVSLVLKRYEDAVRDKDHIRIILGEASIGNDYNLGDARAKAVFDVAERSGVTVNDMDLLLFSAATPKPACMELYSKTLANRPPLPASYAQAQFGKIFHAGGALDIVSASLMMEHEEITTLPPTHFPTMYTTSQLKSMNVVIQNSKWSKKPEGHSRNATIAITGHRGAFGAITLIENSKEVTANPEVPSRKNYLLVVSANSVPSLVGLCSEYSSAVVNATNLAAFCQTSRLCRVSLNLKVAITGCSALELSAKLKAVSRERNYPSVSLKTSVIVEEHSASSSDLFSNWKLDARGTQPLEDILTSLGLKSTVVATNKLMGLKKVENMLIVAVGSVEHMDRVKAALIPSAQIVDAVSCSSVEEFFAALFPYSAAAVFKSYDQFLEIPKCKPVPLPTYIFDRKVVKMPIVEGGLDFNEPAVRESFPTSFVNLPGTFAPEICPVLFSSNQWLGDHKLHNGKIILPGAALVNLALCAIPAYGVIRSLTFARAVFLEANTDAHFVVTPSKSPGSFIINLGKDTYCMGEYSNETVHPSCASISQRLSTLLVDGEELDPKAWYESGAGAISYGPTFQNVTVLRTYSDETALARIDMPSNVASDDWIVHPTLLDACFHMMAIVSTDGSLPVRVENVWVSESVRNATFPVSVWCIRSKVEMEDETQTGNRLEIFDVETGNCVMIIGALVVQVPGAASAPKAEPLVWTNKWTPINIETTSEAKSIWLLVGDNADVLSKLSKESKFTRVIKTTDNVANVLDVLPWTKWSQGLLSFVLHIVLTYSLFEDGATTLQIVYCGTLIPALDLSKAAEWWKHGGYTHFMNVWNDVTSRRIKTVQSISAIIVTPGLATNDGVVSRDAALTGLMLNIRTELRNTAKVLFLNDTNLRASIQQVITVLKHPQDFASGSYSLEGSCLELQKFTALEKAPRKQKSAKKLSILITGGVGGLAKALAEHFIVQGHQVTLAGRRDASDTTVRTALAEINKRVAYLKLDISNAVEVAAALKTGTFDGIVHTAGVLENGLFLNVNDANLKKIGKPKVEGALAILNSLPKDKHCTVVFTSSVAAAVGSYGQTGYVVANSVMDALAMELSNTTPNLIVRSVQLGLVDGVGMANAADDSHTTDDVTIGKNDTVDIISSILQTPLGFAPLVVAAPLGKFLKAQAAKASSSVITSVVEKDEALAFIVEEMKVLLGFKGDLDVTATFSDLGVDSISSVSLQQSIEKKFGITVPLLDLFKMTPDSLVEELVERSAAAQASSVSQDIENINNEVQTHTEHVIGNGIVETIKDISTVVVKESAPVGAVHNATVGVVQELMAKNQINSVPAMLSHHVAIRPNNPLIQLSADPQDIVTFARFDQLSNAAMNLLVKSFDGIDLTVPPVVAIMSGTSPEAMIITMAVWKLGWTTAMLNPKTSIELLIRQAQAVTITAVVAFDERDVVAATTVSGTLASPLLMVDSEKLFNPDGKKVASLESVKHPITTETPLCFLFSSSSVDGTSIKAARLTHFEVLENCKTRDLLWNMSTRRARVLTWLPFSHVMGLIVDFVNNGLVSGMTLCLRPSREHPATPDFLLDDALAMKPTLMYTVPWVLDTWVATFTEKKDVSKIESALVILRRMKAVIAGGAPLRPTTRKFLVANGIHVLEGMGATEAAGTILTGVPKTSGPAVDEEGWMMPLPGVQVTLEPVSGWPVETMGMLAISAPSVSKYVVSARSGESCVGLVPRNLLADGGLFRTGDIFEKRVVHLGEGSDLEEFRFVSRADDAVMLSTGFAVAPRMLEEALVADFADIIAACLLGDLYGVPHLLIQVNATTPLPATSEMLKRISATIKRCAPELQLRESDLVIIGSDFVIPRSPKNTILRGLLRRTIFTE